MMNRAILVLKNNYNWLPSGTIFEQGTGTYMEAAQMLIYSQNICIYQKKSSTFATYRKKQPQKAISCTREYTLE